MCIRRRTPDAFVSGKLGLNSFSAHARPRFVLRAMLCFRAVLCLPAARRGNSRCGAPWVPRRVYKMRGRPRHRGRLGGQPQRRRTTWTTSTLLDHHRCRAILFHRLTTITTLISISSLCCRVGWYVSLTPITSTLRNAQVSVVPHSDVFNWFLPCFRVKNNTGREDERPSRPWAAPSGRGERRLVGRETDFGCEPECPPTPLSIPLRGGAPTFPRPPAPPERAAGGRDRGPFPLSIDWPCQSPCCPTLCRRGRARSRPDGTTTYLRPHGGRKARTSACFPIG